MTEPIFEMEEEIDNIDENINIIPPRYFGITIYTKSNCIRCDILKKDVKHLITPVYIVDCDEYLNKDRDGFIKKMASYMDKEYNHKFKLSFPIVFVDGYFTSRIEFE
jgi:thioredoxin-related protein